MPDPKLTTFPDLLVSDTHFEHAKISDYCQRLNAYQPTPEAVDLAMIANWEWACGVFEQKHGRVPTILHLGDLGGNPYGKKDCPYLRDLPGEKFIVRGNHDHWSEEWVTDHGFTLVEPFSIPYRDWLVLFTHHPIRNLRGAVLNFCGHVHNNSTNSLTRQHANMSVEVRAFTPQETMPLVKSLARLNTEVPEFIDFNTDEGTRAHRNPIGAT